MQFLYSMTLLVPLLTFFAPFLLASESSSIPGIKWLSTQDYKYKVEEKKFEVTFSPASDYSYKSFKISPRRGIVFDLPETYHQFIVDQLVLSHRQSKRSKALDLDQRDDWPGLTSLLFFDPQFEAQEQWRFWSGMSSGVWGAKYAELRSESHPELELLYSFNYYGTKSLKNNKSPNDLRPTQVAAVNVGSSPIFLHQIKVRYLPPEPSEFIEHIYSPSTQFDLFNYGRAKRFGGGELYGGRYPKAWHLSKNEKLRIQLPANKRLSAVDVICGDALGWDSREGKYIPGNAYLNIQWIRNGIVLQNLLIKENVGAQSLLRGLPENMDDLIQEGDWIEISSSSESINFLYIMGYRIGLI